MNENLATRSRETMDMKSIRRFPIDKSSIVQFCTAFVLIVPKHKRKLFKKPYSKSAQMVETLDRRFMLTKVRRQHSIMNIRNG